MSDKLEINVDWERSDDGAAEERACFAAIGITCNDICLTEGTDSSVNRVRPAPFLSAYHLAEWFAWNWWRLRWEPRPSSASSSWAFAHRMATIGHGYVWPNITIFTDGERTALVTKPTRDKNKGLFRYIGDCAAVVASSSFESAFDEFVEQVRGQLAAERVENSNLETIWSELNEERRSPRIAQRRRLEALLGFDPDEADESVLDRLVSDSQILGSDAVAELAADYRRRESLPDAVQLLEIAGRGFESSPRDAVRLHEGVVVSRHDSAAWKRGALAAKRLRVQERLDDRPISNRELSRMAGVDQQALNVRGNHTDVSFALDETVIKGKVVLRSKWETGRRFELARIVGDRIMAAGAGRLFPATSSYTYRQKAQRSFAAELLCPFEAIDESLAGDYSPEAQQDIAEAFNVSELTIRTSLMNHDRIEREGADTFALGENF